MAQNAIAAAGNPGAWTKSLDPNENLTSFNRYIRMFRRWTSVAGLDNFTNKPMWDLLKASTQALLMIGTFRRTIVGFVASILHPPKKYKTP